MKIAAPNPRFDPIMPRQVPALLRRLVYATLPAALGLVGCGGGDASSSDVADTDNCGRCGCGDRSHTNLVPYVPTCGDGGAIDASDTGDASDTSDAIDSSDARDGEAGGSADASAGDALACPDADDTTLNCSIVCRNTTGGYGFPSTCRLVTVDGGARMVECTYVQPCGRRPEGLASDGVTQAIDAVGRQLAEAAFLEAASIDAFAILADELRAHGAPDSLVRRARHAARDEVRHARTMLALSKRHGATPASPRSRRSQVRTLEAIARENAVEGCVRETYGAMVAMWQGRTAEDRTVRRAMKRIARDEAKHAALSWSVARWAERRLDHDARLRIAVARREAIATLRAEVAVAGDQATSRALGLPERGTAIALVDRANAELWACRELI